jgi:hypothetical protein
MIASADHAIQKQVDALGKSSQRWWRTCAKRDQFVAEDGTLLPICSPRILSTRVQQNIVGPRFEDGMQCFDSDELVALEGIFRAIIYVRISALRSPDSR